MPPIADLPHAVLHEVSVNEIALDQKQSETEVGQPSHDDPVALRFGAWANPLGRTKWYLAKISLDVLRWVQNAVHRTEIGFLKLAVDELVDRDGDPVPMLALYLTRDTTGSADRDQQPVAIFTRKGIRFLAPVMMEAGGTAGPAPSVAPSRVTRFYTDGGKFCINMQDDEDNVRAVKYRCLPTPQYPGINPADESTWVAVGVAVL